MSGYVLITAAHDEAAFVGRTCESVLAQTLPPLRWTVVDDASSDDTGTIVERLFWLARTKRDGSHAGSTI